jgi:hypothetical protein
MKVTVIHEDNPKGDVLEWPVVPGTGDFIDYRYPGGTVRHRVTSVEYVTDREGNLTEATVYLEE